MSLNDVESSNGSHLTQYMRPLGCATTRVLRAAIEMVWFGVVEGTNLRTHPLAFIANERSGSPVLSGSGLAGQTGHDRTNASCK